jgi:hypothetical protein
MRVNFGNGGNSFRADQVLDKPAYWFILLECYLWLAGEFQLKIDLSDSSKAGRSEARTLKGGNG